MYEINKKLTVARQGSYIFILINKLTIKIYSNLSQINIHFYLKLQIPLMLRHFLKVISQNPEHVQTRCNISNNLFHFACRRWYLYINPQC